MISALLHTDGNGELLERFFLSLSHILYGDEEGIKGTFRLLIRLSLTIGAFSALCLAFFRQKFEPLIRSFFLPGLAIIALLLTPRMTLEIRDHAEEGRKRIVENVPWFLGNTAGWTSELFYRVKVLFEESMKSHYPWTREIHAGRSPFQPGRLVFSDKRLETDLREFCRECVFRDLGLGLYSHEELSQSTDLFGFLKEKTSRNRTVFFQGHWIPCKEAIDKIDASLSGDLLVEGTLAHKECMIRQLLCSEGSKKQQIAIWLLKEEISPGMSASKRKGERSWFAAAASSLLSLRNFSEALLYLIFPLILLLALLSFGLKLILQWLRLLLWISLWPILYAAVDLFLQSLWEFNLQAKGLTLATQESIASLYSSMEITAALLIASIPLFTWALLQGGISQISRHFSSSTSTVSESSRSTDQIFAKESSISAVVQESSSKQTFVSALPANQERQIFSSETILQKDGSAAAAAAAPRLFSMQEKSAIGLPMSIIESLPKARPPKPEQKETLKMHVPAEENP